MLPLNPSRLFSSRNAGIVSVCLFLLLVWYVFTWYHRMPYWDHMMLVRFLQEYEAGELTFMMLVQNGGGHWHTWAYAAMIGLALLTDLDTFYEILVSLLFGAGTFWAVWVFARQAAQAFALPWFAAAFVMFGAFCVFSLDQAANWLWGWQIAVFMNVCGFAWAVVWLAASPLRVWHTLLAMVAGVLSIYTFATGLALVPVGMLLLWLRPMESTRQRVLHLVLWSVFSVAVVVHYYQVVYLTMSQDSEEVMSFSDVSNWVLAVQFVIAYLGAPISRFASDWVEFFGLGGVILGGWSFWALWRNASGDQRRVLLVFAAFILFALGSGALTALGRVAYGMDQALASRYITFSNFFWLGVLGLAALALATVWRLTGRPRLRSVAVGFAVLVLAMKVGNSAQVAVANARNAEEFEHYRQVVLATYPDVPDHVINAIAYVPERNPIIRERIAFLHDRQLNLFREGNP